MKTIHKYPVCQHNPVEIVNVLDGAEILYFDQQTDHLGLKVCCFWALVDTDKLYRPLEVTMVGTGHPIADDLQKLNYLGTVMADPYVWHFFGRYL
jgi:hypothetical protein